MKAAIKAFLFFHLALAAHAQEFDRHALFASASTPRWELTSTGFFSNIELSRHWYANMELGLSYRTSLLQIGMMANFNQSLNFTFLPPRLIIRVEDSNTEFLSDTRFRARSDHYEINQPFAFFAQLNAKQLSLSGSIATLTQESSIELPRPDVIGDSLVFINWEAINASNTSFLAALAAGMNWQQLTLKAGALNIPVTSFGDKNFKYEYRPKIAPLLSLELRHKAGQILAFTDSKTLSLELAQWLDAFKFPRGKSIDAQIGYQTGLEKFSFHAIRLNLSFPVAEKLRGALGYSTVWSGRSMANNRAFQDWQQSNVLGAMRPLNYALPHQSVFVGLKLELNKKSRRWPLQVVQLKLLQHQIYRAKRAFYSNNPIGTIELYNQHRQPVKVQIALETSGGAAIYRSETFTIDPRETKSQPFYLYLQDTGNDEVESFEQLTISAVIENQSQILTSAPVTVYGKNAWGGDTWELKYFVAPDDPEIKKHAKQLYLRTFSNSSPTGTPRAKFLGLKAFIDALGKNVIYIPDPTTTISVDQVQYPVETLSKGGGDCEDLVVFLASSLMAVGMQTTVVDVRPKIAENISFPTAEPGSVGHVFLLVDTGIAAEFMNELELSDLQGVTRKNAMGKNTIWIPIEATKLAGGFAAAFQEGVRQYYREVIENDGVTKGLVHVYDF